MGAVYYVKARFDYDDEQALVGNLNDYIDERDGNGVDFGLEGYAERGVPRDTLEGVMKHFLTDRGFEVLGPGEFSSSFNASYGWENVLIGMFEHAAPVLRDGSTLEVYPDNGSDIMRVEGGKVVWDG